LKEGSQDALADDDHDNEEDDDEDKAIVAFI
jgi:hypothetical protein